MPHETRHLVTRADGGLNITSLGCDDDSPIVEYYCAKTRFEMARWELEPSPTNPLLNGESLHDWQARQHYQDYRGRVLKYVCRPCAVTDLPIDRTFRAAWVDTGSGVEVSLSRKLSIYGA